MLIEKENYFEPCPWRRWLFGRDKIKRTESFWRQLDLMMIQLLTVKYLISIGAIPFYKSKLTLEQDCCLAQLEAAHVDAYSRNTSNFRKSEK